MNKTSHVNHIKYFIFIFIFRFPSFFFFSHLRSSFIKICIICLSVVFTHGQTNFIINAHTHSVDEKRTTTTEENLNRKRSLVIFNNQLFLLNILTIAIILILKWNMKRKMANDAVKGRDGYYCLKKRNKKKWRFKDKFISIYAELFFCCRCPYLYHNSPVWRIISFS